MNGLAAAFAWVVGTIGLITFLALSSPTMAGDIPGLDTERFCKSKSGAATLLLQSCRQSEAEALGKLGQVKAKVTAEMRESCMAVMRGALHDEGLQGESYGVFYECVVTTLGTE